jgi:hypothetical protein
MDSEFRCKLPIMGKQSAPGFFRLSTLLKLAYWAHKTRNSVIVSGQISCYSLQHSVLLDSGEGRESEPAKPLIRAGIVLASSVHFISTDAATLDNREVTNESSSWKA